ncbi:MAG: hypothetical protein ABXS92_08080, partial [Sulfurimonas sp.]
YYFDRYPVMFSALMNQLLNVGDPTLSQKIVRSRIIMESVFVLIMFLAFTLIWRLTNDPWAALAATLLTFSSDYWIFYKDMVHFDQPAILGGFLLIHGILHYHRSQHTFWIYLSVILAMNLGRSYSSLFILFVWWLFCAWQFLKVHGVKNIFKMIKIPATLAMILGILVAAVNLTYNVYTEARTNNISIAKTSIVKSAVKRLNGNQKFNMEHAKALSLPSFLFDQATRTIRSFVPSFVIIAWFAWLVWKRTRLKNDEAKAGITLTLSGARSRLKSRDSGVWITLALSGLLWLLAMRNLSAFHEYTSIYIAGLVLTFWGFVTTHMPQHTIRKLAYAAIVLFVTMLTLQYWIGAVKKQSTQTIMEFEQIAVQMQPGDRVKVDGSYREIIPGAPYALGFLLSEQRIAESGDYEYILSRNNRLEGTLLTPDNRYIYLYK